MSKIKISKVRKISSARNTGMESKMSTALQEVMAYSGNAGNQFYASLTQGADLLFGEVS